MLSEERRAICRAGVGSLQTSPVVWGQTVNMYSLCECKQAGEGLEKSSQAVHSAGRGPDPAGGGLLPLKVSVFPGRRKPFCKRSSASLR